MAVPVQNIIADSIQRIRDIVRGCSTQSVVAYCQRINNSLEWSATGFSSPAKQTACLLAIMLEAAEQPDPVPFQGSEENACVKPLEDLFMVQGHHSLSVAIEENPSDQEMKARMMASLAYIGRFNQRFVATIEQTITRANLYLAPYDGHLSDVLGITASKALTITQWIRGELQDSLQQRARIRGSELCIINHGDLIARYGDDARVYWNLFTVKRGDGPMVRDPMVDNVVEERPLIQLSNGIATFYDINALYNAVVSCCEKILLNSKQRESYLNRRAKVLESQVAETFPRILGRDTVSYRNLYETPDCQFEHDLVLIHKDICLIVESKAMPLPDPFRDYSRAFPRLEQAFGRSIQHAYEQADRVLNKLQAGEEVALYDRNGVEQVRLTSSMRSFAVCVTRDDYGVMATDLSVLLKKRSGQDYPWVVNILDLENVAEIWDYFNWDIRQLIAYLSHRVKLHGHFFAADELDYLGAYVHHCGLKEFTSITPNFLPIPPYYANIFDAIHSHIHQQAPSVKIRPITPRFDEFTPSISLRRNILSTADRSRMITVGRNQECPCGSGVKFKKCHGR